MGFLGVLKTTVLPLLLAATLYFLLTFLLLPLYRRHRQRYAQYLPLNTITTSTTTAASRTSSFLRDRLLPFVFLPTTWAIANLGRRRTQHAGDTDDDDGNSLFGSEEGEGMVGFDVDAQTRRDAVRSERRTSEEGADALAGSDRRLSRELEEGFRDDSDDDDESARPNVRRLGIPNQQHGMLYS